jgi:hypothetical protein
LDISFCKDFLHETFSRLADSNINPESKGLVGNWTLIVKDQRDETLFLIFSHPSNLTVYITVDFPIATITHIEGLPAEKRDLSNLLKSTSDFI